MVREIERIADIPVVEIATIVPIMLTVGANRIVPGIAIPHPTGRPDDSPERDAASRMDITRRAIKALCTPISEQTVFNE